MPYHRRRARRVSSSASVAVMAATAEESAPPLTGRCIEDKVLKLLVDHKK